MRHPRSGVGRHPAPRDRPHRSVRTALDVDASTNDAPETMFVPVVPDRVVAVGLYLMDQPRIELLFGQRHDREIRSVASVLTIVARRTFFLGNIRIVGPSVGVLARVAPARIS